MAPSYVAGISRPDSLRRLSSDTASSVASSIDETSTIDSGSSTASSFTSTPPSVCGDKETIGDCGIDDTEETDVFIHDRLKRSPTTADPIHAFNTNHLEFGHCSDERFRRISQHPPGTEMKRQTEQYAPQYVMLSTYFTFTLLIVLSRIRDWMGKRFSPSAFKDLMPSNVSVHFCHSYMRLSSRTLLIVLLFTGLCASKFRLRFFLPSPRQRPS